MFTSPLSQELRGLQSCHGVLRFALSLVLPPLLNFLGLSAGFPSYSCPLALRKLLPFRQLRVKEEAAKCLRKEDPGWEEILLHRKPREYLHMPQFPSPSVGCFLVWFS